MENNNEIIMKETEAMTDSMELNTSAQDGEHVMTAGETALGIGIIGGLSVLAWEFAMKPLAKKAVAAGKNVYQKANEKKAGRFEKKQNDDDDLVELTDE